MKTVVIDTSNSTMLCGLVADNKLVDEIKETAKNDHSRRLIPALEKLFSRSNLSPKEVDDIIVINGPGSYTGVRIAVTVAKTYGWSLNKKVYITSSLEAFVANFNEGIIVPIIDARRNNVFCGVYRISDNKIHNLIKDKLRNIDDLISLIKNNNYDSAIFVGEGISKFTDVITENEFLVAENELNTPSTINIYNKCRKEFIDDIHSLVPNYLRIPEAEAEWLKKNKVNG